MKHRSAAWAVIFVVFAVLAAACGSGTGSGQQTAPVHQAEVRPLIPRESGAPSVSGDPKLAGGTLLPFATRLLDALDGTEAHGNVVVSPLSVATAMAMLEPGVTGDVRRRLDQLLGIEDQTAYLASLQHLVQQLESRNARDVGDAKAPGEVQIRVANGAYLQRGYPFKHDYLDTVGRYFGPVVNEVDFRADPRGVGHAIDHFVSDATNGRIRDITAGSVHPDDVVALVNALYLKASWIQPFSKAKTHDGTFTRIDGSKVTVPLMDGFSGASAKGDGWVSATAYYVGGLGAQFILPDRGRFADVAAHLDQVASTAEQHGTKGARLVLPRFSTTFETELSSAFGRLGVGALYQPGHLEGIAPDPTLALDIARHKTFLAMDEDGTEAAAATLMLGEAVSGPPYPPVPVILDRPFIIRIFDTDSGATLLTALIHDPKS